MIDVLMRSIFFSRVPDKGFNIADQEIAHTLFSINVIMDERSGIKSAMIELTKFLYGGHKSKFPAENEVFREGLEQKSH